MPHLTKTISTELNAVIVLSAAPKVSKFSDPKLDLLSKHESHFLTKTDSTLARKRCQEPYSRPY